MIMFSDIKKFDKMGHTAQFFHTTVCLTGHLASKKNTKKPHSSMLELYTTAIFP